VNRTLNTLALLPQYSLNLIEFRGLASSGDLRTFAFGGAGGIGEFMPSIHSVAYHSNRLYTIREGTGENGFTQWLSNLDVETYGAGLQNVRGTDPTRDLAQINDDGSAMVRWGKYRGLSQLSPDPLFPGRMTTDPGIPDPEFDPAVFRPVG